MPCDPRGVRPREQVVPHMRIEWDDQHSESHKKQQCFLALRFVVTTIQRRLEYKAQTATQKQPYKGKLQIEKQKYNQCVRMDGDPADERELQQWVHQCIGIFSLPRDDRDRIYLQPNLHLGL